MEFIARVIGGLLTVVPIWALTEGSGLDPAWPLVCVTGIGLVVMPWAPAFGTRDRGRT